MTLNDVYDQTSACLQLVWSDRYDITLTIGQIRWQGMYGVQTQGCLYVQQRQLWAT